MSLVFRFLLSPPQPHRVWLYWLVGHHDVNMHNAGVRTAVLPPLPDSPCATMSVPLPALTNGRIAPWSGWPQKVSRNAIIHTHTRRQNIVRTPCHAPNTPPQPTNQSNQSNQSTSQIMCTAASRPPPQPTHPLQMVRQVRLFRCLCPLLQVRCFLLVTTLDVLKLGCSAHHINTGEHDQSDIKSQPQLSQRTIAAKGVKQQTLGTHPPNHHHTTLVWLHAPRSFVMMSSWNWKSRSFSARSLRSFSVNTAICSSSCSGQRPQNKTKRRMGDENDTNTNDTASRAPKTTQQPSPAPLTFEIFVFMELRWSLRDCSCSTVVDSRANVTACQNAHARTRLVGEEKQSAKRSSARETRLAK